MLYILLLILILNNAMQFIKTNTKILKTNILCDSSSGRVFNCVLLNLKESHSVNWGLDTQLVYSRWQHMPNPNLPKSLRIMRIGRKIKTSVITISPQAKNILPLPTNISYYQNAN